MRTVYACFYEEPAEPGVRRYFYVGRSMDVLRRMQQHRYAASEGTEDKYEFMRQLESRGLGWQHEVLRVIPDEEYPPDNERWFVIKLTREGHTLMNMRHGSAEQRQELAAQVMSPSIRNAVDVGIARVRGKFVASKRLRRKLLKSTLRREGIPDVSVDTVLPPVIRRRLLQMKRRSIAAGLTVTDIVGSIRAQPMFRRLEAEIEREFGSVESRYGHLWKKAALD